MWEYSIIGLAIQAGAGSPSLTEWQWHAGGERCVLRQNLDGRGAQLELARTPGNDSVNLTLVDRRPAPRGSNSLKEVVISIDSGGATPAEGFVGAGAEPGTRTVLLWTEDGRILGLLSGASALTLSGPQLEAIRITPRSMGSAVKALTECENRKMLEWGIDPLAWRALTVKPLPKTSPTKWVSWFDYPRRRKIYKNDIIVVARLDIGADGSVQNCAIVNSPPPEFREASCRALKRNARLQPAREASGQAIAAPFVIQINFGPIGP